MRQRPEFPVFMDPAERHPVGSPEWAGRICARLCHEFERVEAMGLKPFLQTLRTAIPRERQARPWRHWPVDNPWNDYQSWSQSLFGLEFEKIVAMIGEIDPDAGRELLAIIADEQRDTGPGRPKKGAIGTNLEHGSNQAAYLLRRLAREQPDLLKAYERGEFKSARAAALAAGIVKPPDPYQQICKLWQKLSPEQRDAFVDHIAEWRHT